jgi:integrase
MPSGTKNCLPEYHQLVRQYNGQLTSCTLSLKLGKQVLIHYTCPFLRKKRTRAIENEITKNSLLEAFTKAKRLDEAMQREIAFPDYESFDRWFKSKLQNKGVSVSPTEMNLEGIFEIIKSEYFKGQNRNTGRLRGMDNPSDLLSYQAYYQPTFQLFSDWSLLPSIPLFERVIASTEPGSNLRKNTIQILKKIAGYSSIKSILLAWLDTVPSRRPIPKQVNPLSIENYLKWHDELIKSLTLSRIRSDNAKLSWLSICNLILVYGLRPSEALAVRNLKTDFVSGDAYFEALKPVYSPHQPIYIDAVTSNGYSTKTGKRVAIPMIQDTAILERLYAPCTIPQKYKEANINQMKNPFVTSLGTALWRYDFPGDGAYALRHLANQLGEMYGIPLEQRARSLGHSQRMNETIYKSRESINQSMQILLASLPGNGYSNG